MSLESAVWSFDFESGRDVLEHHLVQMGRSVTSKPAQNALSAARDQIEAGIDFSALYLRTKASNRIPFALRPVNLTEDEARELDDIRKRPSPLEGRRLRGIPKL